MLYTIFRSLFRVFFRVFYRYQVIGREHIPAEGGTLLCCNHISNLDPPLLGSSIERKVRYMAKAELFKIPVLSFLIRSFGAFPVKRGGADRQVLKTSLALLKEGNVLGVFPEGTRSRTGELGKAFTGVGLFALKEECSVVPAAILGPYKLFKPIHVVIGKPIDMSDLRQEKVNSELAREATDRIMGHIEQLINQYKKAS
ncbi:lysophospholipid acyltransferase family protein [Bacillus horti]|uniref:1-acyl-sn-glycerol-3-phosphate acyltransferase n=1 Tax=Caldalkalibacillus horti TaxID=77523 RepID=A0ABT9W5I5_9BACI|nr:lysophospholipid acyltransferase family protein [Bacillus horti]MDQ0168517.1 1-acyl-sn-glycerol-3-phosphate acyltransferase [Bacillus horti]